MAQLECGHSQHVRHNPPWINRPWVMMAEGRAEKLGAELNCKLCDGVDGVQQDKGGLSGLSDAVTLLD